MAYASSSSKTIFISDRSTSTEQVQRHRNPIRTLSSVAGNITRRLNWATTSNYQQKLYTRNIKESPLCRLPPPILIDIFRFLDAKDLYTLSRTCHLLKEVIFNHPVHFPCIHPLASYFYGKTLKEQLHYQTPTFTEKFNGVRWMPTLSEQNDIPIPLKAKASQCPLMTATLARYLSNKMSIIKKCRMTLPTSTHTTAIKILPYKKSQLITAHDNDTIKVWNLLEEGRSICIKTLTGNNDSKIIQFITYTANQQIISGSFSAIQFWDIERPDDQEWVATFNSHRVIVIANIPPVHADINALLLIKDHDVRFVSGYSNGLAIIWTLDNNNPTHFSRLHQIPFSDKSICRLSALGEQHFLTITCENHTLAHVWKICEDDLFQHVTKIRFVRDIKTISRLGHNKLIGTTNTGEEFAVLKRDFLANQAQVVSWFKALPGYAEYERFNSNTTLAELLDGRFASIGEDHVHIWEPVETHNNTCPVLSIPFPHSRDIPNPERNRRFSLFPLEEGSLLAVAITDQIEIWDLTPTTFHEHGEHQA